MNLCLRVRDETFRVGEIAPDVPGNILLEELEEFLTIASGDERKFLTASMEKMVATVTNDPSLWPLLVKGAYRKNLVSRALGETKTALCDQETYNFFETWHSVRKFLSSLFPISVDPTVWHNMREKFPALRGSNFEVDRRTRCLSRPTYSTSATSTGRLTIVAGPNFLVVPAESRKAIVPLDPKGHVVSVDFTSMEPRVALLCSGDTNISGDIYENLMELCEIDSRPAAKLATISALYGASQSRLIETVGSRTKARSIIENVRRFFCVENLETYLESQAKSEGVRNLFGRPLRDATVQPRVRVNHFVQSTAADLAVLLFRDLCSKFESVKPMIVIHDALIVEVPDFAMNEFETACQKISYRGVPFPTTVTAP